MNYDDLNFSLFAKAALSLVHNNFEKGSEEFSEVSMHGFDKFLLGRIRKNICDMGFFGV